MNCSKRKVLDGIAGFMNLLLLPDYRELIIPENNIIKSRKYGLEKIIKESGNKRSCI